MIGVQETPGELLEMAGLFRVPRRRMIRRIYIPAVRPYVAAALQTASGITWKVVVAAEVLSQPMLGIGAELQQARVLLATSGVFAWTILAILVSGVFHLLLSVVLGRDGGPRNRRRSHGRGRDRVRGPGEAARFGGAGGGAA
jgi:NitT/TauT family transport system permease protein